MRTFSRLIFLALPLTSMAESWPRFRGPNGNGRSPTRIPVTWSPETIRWKVDTAPGHGSPILWGQHIYLLGSDPNSGERIPICLSTRDGSVLWSHRYLAQKNKHHKFNSFASSTPAADEDGVVFTWGDKRITMLAFDHRGDEKWKRDLGPTKGGHGFAGSPMIHGKQVLLNNDQDGESSLLAVDRDTGELVWKIPRQSKRLSYSVPCYFEADGRGAFIFNNWQHGITGIDAVTGKPSWEISVYDTSTKERAISSPVIAGDLIIATCGFTANPKHAVAVRPLPGGKTEEVWRVEKSVPHIPTPLVVGDLVFLWEDKGIVSCLEHASGKLIWKERVRGEYFGSPVLADDRIFCITKEGTVSVIKASRQFEMLGTNELEAPCRTTPAIATDGMVVRTWEQVMFVMAESGH